MMTAREYRTLQEILSKYHYDSYPQEREDHTETEVWAFGSHEQLSNLTDELQVNCGISIDPSHIQENGMDYLLVFQVDIEKE